VLSLGKSNNHIEVMGKGTFKVGRDSGTGKFIPVKTALRKPKTTTVETMKISNK
jgi:hypothetical protein